METPSDLPEDFPFPVRTEVEVLGPDEPNTSRPIWTLSDTNLVNFQLIPSDAAALTSVLKDRVRRITWIEEAGPMEFREIHRISRMLYEMSEVSHVRTGGFPSTGFPVLSNLSREDVEILYALDDQRVGWLTNVINRFRETVREHGPVGPVEADLAAKDFLTVMTG